MIKKTRFRVLLVFVIWLKLQHLVVLDGQRQQMNNQEDWVEIELEIVEQVEFLVQDNHKHEFELVTMLQQLIIVQDTIQDKWVYHKPLMEH